MVLPLMNPDMKSQILINAGLGRADHVGQANLLAGNTHAGHAQLLPLQVLIIIMEQHFQQFFLRYSLHAHTSYRFVILQTTYPKESRK